LDKFYPLKTKIEVPDDAERNKLNAENEYTSNFCINKIEPFALINLLISRSQATLEQSSKTCLKRW